MLLLGAEMAAKFAELETATPPQPEMNDNAPVSDATTSATLNA
jgi:hypothetical protein